MTICATSTIYLTKRAVAFATEADWPHVQRIFGSTVPAWEERETVRDYQISTEIVNLDEDLDLLRRMGLEVTIRRHRGQLPASVPRVARDRCTDAGAVHIHLPNLGLLEMDEVTNIDDACTDELRRHLDDGWRIVCVCPPLNQRRPDYILGRSRRDRT